MRPSAELQGTADSEERPRHLRRSVPRRGFEFIYYTGHERRRRRGELPRAPRTEIGSSRELGLAGAVTRGAAALQPCTDGPRATAETRGRGPASVSRALLGNPGPVVARTRSRAGMIMPISARYTPDRCFNCRSGFALRTCTRFAASDWALEL